MFFKAHYDATEYNGEQESKVTLQLYLNQEMVGGATTFIDFEN